MKRLLLTLILLCTTLSGVAAQDMVTLKILMPEWVASGYDEAYFDDFRSQFPNVNVVVTGDANAFPPSAPVFTSIEQFLEEMENYVTRADVFYLSGFSMIPEAVRGGYWLNLAPLAGDDPEIQQNNYYNVAWETFAIDGGLWGLPVTIEPQILGYLPEAFDEAGLTYPDESWTIEQFAQAALALTEFDEDGNPTRIGFFGDTRLMLRSLLGENLYDDSTGLTIPRFDNPELAAMLEVWSPVQAAITPTGGYSSQGVGLQIAGHYAFAETMRSSGNVPLTPAFLPNGYSGARVNGFAVSAGTAYPELAYELVKYLSLNPRRAFFSSGELSANRSLTASTAEGGMDMPELTPDTQAFIDQAMQNMLGDADERYFEYVYRVMSLMQEEGLDARTALQQVEAEAISYLEAAAAQHETHTLMVATPQPTADFSAGEIVLRFGINGPVPDLQAWERLAAEFAAGDPVIGQIVLQQQGINDYEQFMQDNDCFFLNYDAADSFRREMWLPLDPFLDADPNFDTSDLVPGVLQQLQFEGYTYGYPFTVQPVVLQYETEVLEALGVAPNDGTWTLDEFLNALAVIDTSDSPGTPFYTRVNQNTDLLMVVAAYGALPVDYRTTPPTYQFTDPATVAAIEQVLNLAKDGVISYEPLGTFNFAAPFSTGVIQTRLFNGYDLNLNERIGVAVYPQGTQYSVVGFGDSGGGYIAVDAVNPDACYRWISTIAAHPELFGLLMPARLSLVNDPATIATQGSELVAVYNQIIALMNEPNAVVFPSAFGGGGFSLEDFVIGKWLNRAFDAYMLEDADLEIELEQAQMMVDAYRQCLANADLDVPESDPARECVAQVDPELDAEWNAAAGGAS